MRVVFMSATRQVWGAEVSLLTLAEALMARGVEVALVALPGELPSRAAELGFDAVHLATPSPVAGEGRLKEARGLWRTYRRHARRGDRLVLFSYFLVAFAPVYRASLRVKGVRIVLDLHDHLPGRKARWGVQACARGVDAVIACSRFAAEQVAHTHPRVDFLHRPVTTLPDDPSSAARAGAGSDAFRVGVVGRISPEKRHRLVVDAVSRLDEEAELVVRGAADGWSAGYVEQALAEGRRLLGPRFVDEGRVAPEKAMAGLDAVVVGNPHEAMGRTVLEAQTRGVVPVVPDSGGSQELVEDGVTGLVYASDDAQDLARALRRAAADEELASRVARVAPSRVSRPSSYAADYLALLTAPRGRRHARRRRGAIR